MVPAACKALPHRSRDPRPAPSTLDRRPPTAARAARAPCCRATDGPARSLRWTAARASPQPSPHGKVRGSLAAGSLVLAVGNSVGTVAIVQFEPTKRQPSPDGAPGLVLDTLVLLCIYLLGAKRFRFLRVSAKSRVGDFKFAMTVGVGAGAGCSLPACARGPGRPAGDLGTDAAPLDRVADGGGDRQTERLARRRSSPWGSLSPRRRRTSTGSRDC